MLSFPRTTQRLTNTRHLPSIHVAFALAVIVFTGVVRADIYEWQWVDDNDHSLGKVQSVTLCPDGAGVTAGPGVNVVGKDLTQAYLIGANLQNIHADSVILLNADLSSATLTQADFGGASLSYANFSYSNLTSANLDFVDHANFSHANLTSANVYSDLSYSDFSYATFSSGEFLPFTNFTGANFNHADLSSASFDRATLNQASMIGTNLSYSNLASCMLSGMDLTGNNLSFADLSHATLNNAVLHGANLNSAKLAAVMLEAANLSTVDLTSADARSADFSNANLSGANLTSANFSGDAANNLLAANLSGANLSHAVVSGANFKGANLAGANLSQLDFHGVLTSQNTDVTNADFTGSDITGAGFVIAQGFKAQQLYSTANYHKHDLTGIAFASRNLMGWDFSNQNLASDPFSGATLTNANFAGAWIAGARFTNPPPGAALTAQQLYSTASYQNQDLHGIFLTSMNLTGWNFSAQNITNVFWGNTTLDGTNCSTADLRGSYSFSASASTTTTNAILPAGNIEGLNLGAGQSLTIRDFDGMPTVPLGSIITPVPIVINSAMSMSGGSTLTISLHDANWGSTISFATGIPVTLGGALDLVLDSSADIHGLIGTPNHIFNWNSPLDPDNHFDQITTDSRFLWDTTGLYSTGIVEIVHLFGDVDDNGVVDVADLSKLAQDWQLGTHGGDPTPLWSDGDFNGDGIVNIDDLKILASNWGVGDGPSDSAPSLSPLLLSLGLPDVAVPEPAGLLGLFALIMLARRRRE